MKHLACHLDELKKKIKIPVEINHQNILLVYSNEKVYAIMDKCPHMGVSLSTGMVKDGVIKCKEHGLGLSLETGQATSQRKVEYLRLDKHSQSVKTYPTIIKDQAVYVVL